jgi:hypothetical protein
MNIALSPEVLSGLRRLADLPAQSDPGGRPRFAADW